MEEGQPYFAKPRKSTDHADHSDDEEYNSESGLTLTKEPRTPTKSGRQDPEDEYKYPSPPNGDGVAPGYWSHPGHAGPPPPRDQSTSQPLPRGRVQQPAPLPGNRIHPADLPPVSSNSFSPRHVPDSTDNTGNDTAHAIRDPSPPFANGPRVGHTIPPRLAAAANAIMALGRDYGDKPPKRTNLKSRLVDPFITEHFNSRDGMLRNDSVLREWYGDKRLFPTHWWEFFVYQKAREKARTGG